MQRRTLLAALAAAVVPGVARAAFPRVAGRDSRLPPFVLIAATPWSISGVEQAKAFAFLSACSSDADSSGAGIAFGYLADEPLEGVCAADIRRRPRFLDSPRAATIVVALDGECRFAAELQDMFRRRGERFVFVQTAEANMPAGEYAIRAVASNDGFDLVIPDLWMQQCNWQFARAAAGTGSCNLEDYERFGYRMKDIIHRENVYYGKLLAALILRLWEGGGIDALNDQDLARINIARDPDGTLASTNVSAWGRTA